MNFATIVIVSNIYTMFKKFKLEEFISIGSYHVCEYGDEVLFAHDKPMRIPSISKAEYSGSLGTVSTVHIQHLIRRWYDTEYLPSYLRQVAYWIRYNDEMADVAKQTSIALRGCFY